jgi:hypothetical protein
MSVLAPEQLELKVEVHAVDAWTCRDCSSQFVQDETITYYDPGDWSWQNVFIEVGEAESYFRANVSEFKGVSCPNCGVILQTENAETTTMYVCPDLWCDMLYEDPHEALLCCSPGCDDPRDLCLAGISQIILDSGPDYYKCRCNSACEVWVCSVCHHDEWNVETAKVHFEETHEEQNEVMEDVVDVGGPQNLPPALPFEEESVAAQDCPVCSSEFCCRNHDTHKQPHRGCFLR